jgi:hypothetical protein
MFVGTLVTFALDLFILPWIAELTGKRKRFTQTTKYNLRSFGGRIDHHQRCRRYFGGVSGTDEVTPRALRCRIGSKVEPVRGSVSGMKRQK